MVVDRLDRDHSVVLIGAAVDVPPVPDRAADHPIRIDLEPGAVRERLGRPMHFGEIDDRTRTWYNPNLDSRYYYVPAIVAFLVMLPRLEPEEDRPALEPSPVSAGHEGGCAAC